MQIKMVKSLSSSFLFLSTLFLLLSLPCHAIPELIQSFIYGGCSPPTTNSTNTLTATLLASLQNTSSHSSFGRATVTAPNDVVLHGLFQCRGDLSSRDCSSCVAHSVALLTSTCPPASGGSLQLQGCYVKAPTTSSFLKSDGDHHVVVYKRFGGEWAGGGGRYEEVLNGLRGKGGPYRAVVGPNGAMGQAQCLEEISQRRCQSCVAAAVKVLTAETRNSRRGDVFMNSCYARYSCSNDGGYVARSAYTTAGSSDSGVKTFALIAGSLAGIVVLVIFLTFVCREFA
ncbi:hypothetical protein V2J09_003951 [Rumex salicifolius]